VLSINAVEGFPLEDFSAEAVRSQISEAQKIASGSGSEQDIAEAKIELEVSLHKLFFYYNLLISLGFGELAGGSEVDRSSMKQGAGEMLEIAQCISKKRSNTARFCELSFYSVGSPLP
jgi:hypothetical protein